MVNEQDWQRGWRLGEDFNWDRVAVLPEDQLSPDFNAGFQAARSHRIEQSMRVARHLEETSQKESNKRLRVYRWKCRLSALRRVFGIRGATT